MKLKLSAAHAHDARDADVLRAAGQPCNGAVEIDHETFGLMQDVRIDVHGPRRRDTHSDASAVRTPGDVGYLRERELRLPVVPVRNVRTERPEDADRGSPQR